MKENVKDRMRGCIFGQAIGDALGLGTEFMKEADVKNTYPAGLTRYEQIKSNLWEQGEWSDDTDMMLCIANSIIEERGINTVSIARYFKAWYNSKPKDIGITIASVLGNPDYENNPFKVAEKVYADGGSNGAANGALMRTSIVGLWKENNEDHAATVCRLTHPDMRCVGTCAILSVLIYNLALKGKELTVEELLAMGDKYDKRINEYIMLANTSQSLEAFHLDDASMGYTLYAFGAALWALFHVSTFEDGLVAVVNAGGDADTNAAVAAALLGAKFGYNAIPEHYINGLRDREKLADVADKFIALVEEKLAKRK